MSRRVRCGIISPWLVHAEGASALFGQGLIPPMLSGMLSARRPNWASPPAGFLELHLDIE